MSSLKDKLKNTSTEFRAALAFMMASVLERAIQMITSPIFTRLMTPMQYGTVSLFNSFAEIIGLFALLSLSSGIFNNGMFDFKEDRDSYVASSLLLSNIATIITVGVIIIIKLFTKNSIIPFEEKYLAIMFCVFFVKPAYRFWLARARYEYRYKSVLIVSILLLVLSSIVSIFSTIYMEDKAFGRILGRDSVFFLAYLLFYYNCYAKGKIKFQYMRYSLGHSLYLLPFYLSKYILNHFDQVMIASLVDNASSGKYSVAYTAGFAIKIIWEAVNAAMTPWIYNKLGKNEINSINRLAKKGLIIYVGLTIIVSLIAPEIMRILASKNYYEGVYCIAPVVCGVFFVGINGWFSIVLFYYKKSKTLSGISMILAMLNVILNYFGIKKFGYSAAAYSTLICYAMQSFYMFWAVKKLINGVYNGVYIAVISLVTVITSLSAMTLYKLFWIRYVMIFLIGMGVCVFAKYIFVNWNDGKCDE